jgi:phage gp36-like protein
MTDAQITSASTKLTNSANEASRLVDLYLMSKEENLPLAVVPAIIADITADFGASIYKRRYAPSELRLAISGLIRPKFFR